MAGATSPTPCVFCQIARNSTSTPLLHSDEKVVAFQDIKPAAYRHYLVISVDHIPTVRDLQRRAEDYSLAVILSSETHVECWARTVTTRCSSVQSVQIGAFVCRGTRIDLYGWTSCFLYILIIRDYIIKLTQ
ncbi:bifunctional adenosine 5'-phosphosulfate phosphorylase/adenylylsulfatase HINT4 isoform X2 [Citrus sinensis]|uniref:bifunctional adenosine 5'-phosphosulfate phosphorylase/adenylylsulfatase HINT4 isoform X2 n=1 Tax=Citrus sinensis TaxID=2711 RepID=UPI002277B1BD|nr:bifunctional adenosine 5'-phosphosulfate phosphorylase/adenylylsulfatase HINT4 isoform X2 [Citrus sinensis]